MLRPPQGKRGRPRYGAHLCCAAAAAFLLLLSISVLHSRLSSSSSSSSRFLHSRGTPAGEDAASDSGLVPDDANDDAALDDDRIDALDVVEEADEAEEEDEADEEDAAGGSSSGGYFWDHALGVRRRSFGGGQRGRRRGAADRPGDTLSAGDRGGIAFASDDQPVEEEIRLKLSSIRSIEDALLLKGGGGRSSSPLREGWAPWFEAKGRYLRQDRMFGSGVDRVDPRTHPLLQDPDAGDVPAGLTRGDRLLQKAMWKDLERIPFPGGVHQMKRVERKALGSEKQRVPGVNNVGGATVRSNAEEKPKYADGRHWGYYPGLEQHLSFSEFLDRFLSAGRCSLRVFMVWNSPPWAYSVRHQRGLESLLHHHRDACVVVFSETMELNFFKDFVKDGFIIAVAMPNLDELLKDTPAHVFASVWFEWRKTKHYPIHYSELIRLAALYKYGGVYLDSDVIVLKPLYSLKNSVGIEDEMSGNPIFNGAVMAVEKQSPIIMECMREFYSTYDDTLLRWNGAELLTRVINRLVSGVDKLHLQIELKIAPSHSFFPISAQNITRYFSAPIGDVERTEQDLLLTNILNTSITFHFWNGLTSTLVPETDSLVEKLLNHYCLHCLDVL